MFCPKLALLFGLSLTLAVGCGAAPEASADDAASDDDNVAEEGPGVEPAPDPAPSPVAIAERKPADLVDCRIDSVPCPFEDDFEDDLEDDEPLLPPLPPVVDPVPMEHLLEGAPVEGLDGRSLTESLTTR